MKCKYCGSYVDTLEEQEKCRTKKVASSAASVGGSKACCYEATTTMVLRIVEFMQTFQADPEMLLNEFVGEMGEYEIKLAEREGITIKP